jgi:hypothetical protein
MGETDATDSMLAELGLREKADTELTAAVQSAVRFLAACVEGQIADAAVGDRIAAAKVILEHAAKQPDLLGELAGMAGTVRDEDVAVLLGVLD